MADLFQLDQNANWLEVADDFSTVRNESVEALNAWYRVKDTVSADGAREYAGRLDAACTATKEAQAQARDEYDRLQLDRALRRQMKAYSEKWAAMRAWSNAEYLDGEQTKERREAILSEWRRQVAVLLEQYPLVARNNALARTTQAFGWYVYRGQVSANQGLSWYIWRARCEAQQKAEWPELLAA